MMMSTSRLYDIIAQVMSVPASQINDESGPESIENWDSFLIVVLIDEIERAFKVKFTLEEVTNTKTVSNIKRNLHNHGVVLDGQN
jgi:acyl carrier protein